ncbi:MAG TPA: DNA alkylation repair protein [Tissierellales bacterium]|nr:DNA alkylation repair protein [Tissierellales bacterium]
MDIFEIFYSNRNEEQSKSMAKYIRYLFTFLGLKKPERAALSKEVLKAIIHNSETTEFFINKAIGWTLREYSKTDRKWVENFIEQNSLDPLSVKEGSRYL